ncbi:unnamed protein product [Miscanthus lutarioriparius]|uniref:Uncharacterized protein n=1 Tax=Miscanthus lutarioriparius TaxID=422564 RepID=A0A811SKN1_9POAL|nr:unnamed protein product [Miscanthus lutarioriparius]
MARFQKKSFPLYEDCTSLYVDSVQGASGGRKLKQSHIGAAIEGFVQYKKMQTSKTMEALNEKKKQDEECLVDVMELTDVEKAYAMNIFKSKIDREVFIKMKNKNVRLIWLKQQIRVLGVEANA